MVYIFFKLYSKKKKLAILLFTVNDNDIVGTDDFIAQYALPITCIREGYRCIPLKDRHV